MNPFATHIPALLACLEHTSGPVLELGSGWFSTPIVSAFATDRLVRTIETNPEWFTRVSGLGIYQPITHHRHQFLFVPDYNDAPILDQEWDVVVLDHEPPPRRGHDALVLRDRCRIMIGHDSEHPDYRYAEAFPCCLDFHVQTCRRHYPGGTERMQMPLLLLSTAAFPEKLTGRLPQTVFRGLLSVHSRSGLLARWITN